MEGERTPSPPLLMEKEWQPTHFLKEGWPSRPFVLMERGMATFFIYLNGEEMATSSTFLEEGEWPSSPLPLNGMGMTTFPSYPKREGMVTFPTALNGRGMVTFCTYLNGEIHLNGEEIV